MAVDIPALLKSYPRQRPPLSDAHKAAYKQEYRLNREGVSTVGGIAIKLEAWMHRRVSRVGSGAVLELGAGTLNHLAFEADNPAYDAVEPMAFLYEGSERRQRVRDIFPTVQDVPGDRRYGRIISVAVLEHMCDLPRDVARAALAMDEGAHFLAGIPSEGGLAWGLAWRMTTGVSYRLRTGLDYKVQMRHEHINTAPEIIAVLRHLFENVSVARFPLPVHHLSFYTVITATAPRLDRCRDVLAA